MRAGLVIYGALDTLSGGYLYDRMLVRTLVVEGWTVDLYTLAWRGYAKHIGDNLNPAWRTQLLQAPVDVLIQDELNHPSLVAVNRRLRTQVTYPIVSLVHHLRCSEEHPAPLRILYRWVERHYLNGVDAIIANSRTTLASVDALLDRPKPALVAYPAANHLPAATAAGHAGPLRILFVGNLIPRKGLHSLLDGLAQSPRGLWRLTVVGRQDVDVGYTKKIAAKIDALADPSSVQMLGRIDDTTLAAAYATHDLLAVPSYEGFGIVYLEAMRWGLPVLASTAGAAHEIVTDRLNGFLVAPHDSAAIAAAVTELATDRTRLAQMRTAAQARYDQHPTWEQSMTTVSRWLTELVNKP